MKVNILGTEYTVYMAKPPSYNKKLEGVNGYVEFFSKEIVIDDFEPDALTVNKPEELKNKVLRHEIVHAFFHESGCSEWTNDENLVEWIAIQVPKMAKAMKEAGAISDD